MRENKKNENDILQDTKGEFGHIQKYYTTEWEVAKIELKEVGRNSVE